jgi:GTP:adenosylcobinamide-phosphate guanylyltransferase
MTGPASPGPRHVVVLAGRRSADDPLAVATGAPHRALLDIQDEPMLVRVARQLLAWPSIERLFISIDAPELLEAIPFLREAQREGQLTILRSADSPSQSVIDALEAAGVADGPVLVTTADHALLDDAILRAFFEPAFASPADLNVGLVSRTIIEARFPTTKRTYLGFRDDGYSGANLFLFKNDRSRVAADFWRRVENDRKKPWRIAKAFGLATLLLFVARRLTLESAMERVSRIVGARVEAIALPIAEAAVDVDKIEDWELVREILAERARAQAH